MGEHDAFKEAVNLHIRKIVQLAIQFGVPLSESGRVAEAVFRELFNKLNELTELQLEEESLLKVSIQKLKEIELDVSSERLFSFEEDNELHHRIIRIPREIRVPLILAKFHNKSVSEIGSILAITEQEVEQSIKEAMQLLAEPNLDKKLELLNISYQRLQPSYEESNIYKIDDVLLVQEPVVIKKKRKPFLLWSVGGIALIALLFISVVRSEAYQQSAKERFIEKMNQSFQQELDDRFELVGLSEPVKAIEGYTMVYQGYMSRVSAETYGYDTKYKFNKFIRELESNISAGGRINKKDVKQKYDELIMELRLPSEMLEQLQKNPLTDDREQSLIFLDELRGKTNFLSGAYNEILDKNMEIILASDLVDDGIVDIDRLIEHAVSYPIDFRDAIVGMDTQYFSLTSIKEIAPLHAKFGTQELEDILRGNLHPDMQIYLSLLYSDKLFVAYTGNFEEQLETLLAVEKELPNTEESDSLADIFNSNYIFLFLTTVGLNHESGIFDASGAVRQDIKEKWMRLVANGKNYPSGQIIQKVIDEMEATNWTTSSSLDDLLNNGVWAKLQAKIRETRAGKYSN